MLGTRKSNPKQQKFQTSQVSNVAKFLADRAAALKKKAEPDTPLDPADPNDFGLMDRAKMDEEFPTEREDTKKFGEFDFRKSDGQHPILLDTPEKMDEDYRAMAQLRKVNELSHVHRNLKTDDDDEDDD